MSFSESEVVARRIGVYRCVSSAPAGFVLRRGCSHKGLKLPLLKTGEQFLYGHLSVTKQGLQGNTLEA